MSEKSKNILLGVLIVGLVSMTVAYAALSTSLSIRGTANVDATNWDIHFTNVHDATTNGEGSNTLSQGSGKNEGSITAWGSLDQTQLTGENTTAVGTLINGLTINLKKPGDWVKVNFDIVNTGTIDAKLAQFSKSIVKTSPATPSTTEANDVNDGITYTVKCGETRATAAVPSVGQELAKTSGKAECELYVYYNELTNNHTAGTVQTAGDNNDRTFTLNADWQYVQK